MASEAMVWAWQQTCKDALSKLILVRLADHSARDDDGTYGDVGAYVSWPSVRLLEESTQASQSTVHRKLAELVKAGLVRKLPRQRRNGSSASNVYVLGFSQVDTRLPVTVTPLVSTRLEPSVEPLAVKPPKERKSDIVWDALVAICGAPATRSETSDFAKTVSEIRPMIPLAVLTLDAAEATNRVRWAMDQRRKEFVRRYPDATFTHRVLRNRWNELRPSTRQERNEYPELEDGAA